jgi:hypothetical protein
MPAARLNQPQAGRHSDCWKKLLRRKENGSAKIKTGFSKKDKRP